MSPGRPVAMSDRNALPPDKIRVQNPAEFSLNFT
jgi:hypothetical protein